MCPRASEQRAGGRRPGHQESAVRKPRRQSMVQGCLRAGGDTQNGEEAFPSVALRGTRSRAHMPLWYEPPPLDTGQSPSAEPQLALIAAADLGESLHSPAPHFLPLTFIQCCLLILCRTQARLDVPKQTKGKDNPQNGGKYLQTKRTTDSSPKHTNSSHSSVSKTQTAQSKHEQI